ncbi:MFS transporter [Paragemmobacter straminiformis]|uniref:MFS transporter n=1 Tax=Paragemmobacter straminiformis TaxID=2045119 RepID=A0A842I8T8_9RHOB|nr:MFS transporter [Gemmobacter straminiformis]MBC2836250.1 MFS transporter [Gemmobacter straminiformis]
MKIGIASLVCAYVLSQFYRAFLAVLSPVLKTELGASAEDLATASGLWFLAFALMQLPVGRALDSIGPRRTTAVLLALGGGGGATIFAMAQGPVALGLAMVLIGAGCAPVLMAAYYIFARTYSAAVFGTLAGAMIGFGSLGNVAASLPLSAAVAAFGWRGTLWAMAALTLAVAAGIALLVRDPERVVHDAKGSLFDLLKMPALWPVLVMMVVCYAPAAGLRGLWVGPYFADVFNADSGRIGQATLVMGLAMVAGNFAYGPLERLLGTRKWLIFGGNMIVALCLLALWWLPHAGATTALALFAAVGFFGSSFGMVIAHGRAFFPPHLIGRGVTLLNLFGIAAVGLAQVVTGRLHAATDRATAAAPYQAIFGFFAIALVLGLAFYTLSRDRTD